jgi:8-oxo-dGTP pyrophosphatase MutT (NUDIX family)
MPSPLPVRTQVSSGGVAFRAGASRIEIAIVSVGERVRWQLPKGIVDPGETPELTAVREVREEAGIDAELLAPLEVVEYWYVGDERGGGRVRFHKYVHFFLLRYVAGDVAHHDHEVNESRWVEISDAASMLAFANERGVVERARVMIQGLGATA